MLKKIRNSLSGQLFQDGFWSLCSSLLDRGGALLLTVFVARQLGVEALGTFNLIVATYVLVANPAAYAFNVAATRSIAETLKYNIDQSASIVNLVLLISSLFIFFWGGVFLVFPSIIARELLLRADVATLLQIGFILFIGEFLRKVGIGFFVGFRAYKEQFISSCIIMAGVLCTFLVSKKFGIPSVLITIGLTNFLAFGVGGYLIWRRYFPFQLAVFSWRPDFIETSSFGKYAFPAFFSSLLPALVVWYVQVQLVHYGNEEQLGLFSASNQIRMAIVFLPAVFSSVLVPRMVRNLGGGENDHPTSTRYIGLSIASSLVIVVILASFLTLFSHQIASIFGPSFEPFSSLFVIMIWVGCLNGVNQTLGAIIMSRDSMWIGVVSNSIWALLLGALALLWMPDSLSVGLAFAMLWAYLVVTILQLAYIGIFTLNAFKNFKFPFTKRDI